MYAERPSDLPGSVVWSESGAPSGAKLVLPDGCTDLLFDGRRLFIAGPDTVAQDTPIAGADGFIGLRVGSGIGPTLWGVPGNELVNQRVLLESIWPEHEVARLTEKVATAADPAAVLERIAARRWRASPPDRAMVDVVARLRHGSTVAEAAEATGFSARQFHRRSLHAFGYGAKTLHRILRMNAALDAARAGGGFAVVAASSGYADQAHLAREVRALTRHTLTDLLR
jgi:AraC-like DNA-binding protein